MRLNTISTKKNRRTSLFNFKVPIRKFTKDQSIVKKRPSLMNIANSDGFGAAAILVNSAQKVKESLDKIRSIPDKKNET